MEETTSFQAIIINHSFSRTFYKHIY